MGLVLVVGLLMGWQVRRASIQRRAVAEVQALGGRVSYEDQIGADGSLKWTHRPGGPKWLRGWLGDEFFQEVAWVVFDQADSRHAVDDRSIGVLNNFPRLQGFLIEKLGSPEGPEPVRRITEAGLDRLTGLARLRVIHWHQIGTNAAMMARLGRCVNLEELTVVDAKPRLPGASLAVLGGLGRLKRVFITSVESSRPEDLAPLTALRELETLTISHSPTEDAGIGRFGAMTTLTRLDLGETKVSMATLAEIAQNPNLTMLSFDGSRLAPGGLRPLSKLKKLQYLMVSQGGRATEPNAQHLIHRVPKRFDDTDLDALGPTALSYLCLMGLDATDSGVARLLQNHSFTFLTLSGRGITDASVPHLVKQTGCVVLALADTSLTDAGLAQLGSLRTLGTLSLVDNARLTEAGLDSLKTIPSLRHLTIRQTGLRPETLASLRTIRSNTGLITVDDASDDPKP